LKFACVSIGTGPGFSLLKSDSKQIFKLNLIYDERLLSVTHLSILGEEVVCVEVDCAEVANLIKLEYQLDESGAQGVVAPSNPARACKNKYTPPHMTLDMPHTTS
jgi:hypothetical protein